MSNLPRSIPLAEAKNKLSELIERVIQGEEFVITRHNAQVARLIPTERASRHDVSEAIARMRATRKRRRASTAEILSWKNAGRR
jgi:prevent-host-death family protein